MAQIAITELRAVALTQGGGNVLAVMMPPLAEQRITLGAVSVQSSAFDALASFVRVASPATCFVAFGENPTATDQSMRLAANVPELFGITPGHKLAVIQQA